MSKLRTFAKHVASPEKQSGQAILLIAMLMIVLLASLGLAIDGGGLFLDWRDAQNAADTAAIQAAYAYCTSGFNTAVTTGMSAAKLNGFNSEGSYEDSGGTITTTATRDEVYGNPSTKTLISGNRVDVHWASQFEPYKSDPTLLPGGVNGPTELILVRIKKVKPSFFIQLVYGGPLTVTAEAMGACKSGSLPFSGNSIYTLGTDAECNVNVQENQEPPLPDTTNSGAPLYLSGEVNLFSPLTSNGSLGMGAGPSYLHDDAYITIAGGVNTNSVEFLDGEDNTLYTYKNGGTNLGEVVFDNDTPQLPGSYPPLYDIYDFLPSTYTPYGYSAPGVDGMYWLAAKDLEKYYIDQGKNVTLAHDPVNNRNPNGTSKPDYSLPQQNGNASSTEALRTLRGLYIVDGDVSINTNAISDPEYGFTIVSTGKITFSTSSGEIWGNFGLKTIPKDSLPINYPALYEDLPQLPLMFTTYQGSPCAENNGIKISANRILMFGNIYAPTGSLDWSASKVLYCGAMITYSVSIQASNTEGAYFFGDKMPAAGDPWWTTIETIFEPNSANDPELDFTPYKNLKCNTIDDGDSQFFFAK